jgi:hypothetical protein
MGMKHMPKIRFSGIAGVFDGEEIVEDVDQLKSLDDLTCDDEDSVFSDYLADGGDDNLINAGVSGGLLWFEFDATEGALIGHTEYDLVRLLNKKEQNQLKEYTIGQWSDGIGSGFSQSRIGVGLMPQLLFFNDNDVVVKQTN